MKTAILTDTNSGITPDEGKQRGIFVIPMPVIVDHSTYYEGQNISQEEFYDSLTGDKQVTTSMPSPGDMMENWDLILKSGYDELVYIPMSSGLSNSCHSAIGLAAEYDGKVQVADNHRISVTLRQSVLDAKWLADKGHSAKEIKDALEKAAYDSSIYIAVNTLEYLKRGGRVTAAAAAIGTVLKLKPILTIQGEKLDAFAKVRGNKKCEMKILDAVFDDLKKRFGDEPEEKIYIGAAGTFLTEEGKEHWLEQVKERFPKCQIWYDPLSFSIGCHVGPDATGIGICKVLREE